MSSLIQGAVVLFLLYLWALEGVDAHYGFLVFCMALGFGLFKLSCGVGFLASKVYER